MFKYQTNANRCLFSNTIFSIRYRFWPRLKSLIILTLLLLFTPLTGASESVAAKNNDRTVATIGPREIQAAHRSTPSILPAPSSIVESQIDDFSHALYVITLDGKITAISVDDRGQKIWTADTGSPLVDSSLSKIEMSRESNSVRLIPSLIGGLYEKYDDDGRVEALPFDADSLLDSSFKLHEDLVITGGKHIDTLGLDSKTGQIIYSFSKDDDKQQKTTDHNNSQSTLVVRRTTQTVRARSARSGYEKWNFSVSNHELLYLHGQQANFVAEPVHSHKNQHSRTADHFQYQLQSGIIFAFDDKGKNLWSSSINAPIAAVWEYKNGKLIEKSLFEIKNTSSKESDSYDNDDDPYSKTPVSQPLAFIGEFNSTPYVLVPSRVQKQLIHSARKIPAGPRNRRPKLLAWDKAYQKRTIYVESDSSENAYARALGVLTTENKFALALRPSSTPQESTAVLEKKADKSCETSGYFALMNPLISEENDEHRTEYKTSGPTKALAISTVFLGAVLTLISFLIYKKQKGKTLRQQSSMTDMSTDCTNFLPTSISSSTINDESLMSTTTSTPITPPFQSRYNSEYEHVRFLGRGGFGVVFEAINKLDERRVAIKRVSLKKASGKERALKEIRYLAVLNHPNLIQYYYAWNESPPVGWQEDEDKHLLIRQSNMTRDSISSFPTSANDSESIPQSKSTKLISKGATRSTSKVSSPLIEFTFDRSENPLRIDENFSNQNSEENKTSESDSSESCDSDLCDSNNNNSRQRTKRNRLLTTTKSSLSSSSPFFDHSSTSSDEEDLNENQQAQEIGTKEKTETDDGIVFQSEEKNSSSNRAQNDQPLMSQSNSIADRKALTNNEKELPTTYFYFVMELCQPESLRDRLTRKTIDRYQAWSIFDQIVQGIEYIHSKKLIHRDLKPSNILFSMDNTVKIGDFGLVSAFGEDKSTKKKKRDEDKSDKFQLIETFSFTSDAGGNNEIGGTILYMSPEQINRESYNQKVDIYAMGIILFELLYPFSTQMERMHALAKVRQDPPVFPADFECEGNNRKQLICRLIRWLLSHSARDRPKAADLRQDTFYQRVLQLEVFVPPNNDARQPISTMVNGQDSSPPNSASGTLQQRGRISSSPFRRTVSSSILQSHRNSESVDIDSVL